jgi:two-component system alkaline phosphatase synthesis response regulator PhoP
MSNAKILVVDDEKDLREALTTSLTTAGFTVVSATDGEEGLKKALNEKPNLILLDIVMPKVNGHQMLRELRRDAWGKKVPVLLLTNADDAENISKSVAFDGNDYIIKSQISLEDVVKKVKQHLAGYHG